MKATPPLGRELKQSLSWSRDKRVSISTIFYMASSMIDLIEKMFDDDETIATSTTGMMTPESVS
jgi:hypothetical protein